MLTLGLASVVAFVVGSLWGKSLAGQGITSDNALLKQQKFFVLLIVAIAVIFVALIILDKSNLNSLLPQLFPPIILIYLAGWYHRIIFVAGFFILGLLLFIELNGKYNRRKLSQLIAALTLISCVLSILGYCLQPVDKLLQESKIENGVVMQTTFYTCAPSAIATLARHSKIQPNLTEAQAIRHTHTNRFGTTTLKEIEAMQELNLNPEYKHNLKIEDLIETDQLALLHVKERNKDDAGVRFAHAVALLATDPQKQLFVIGNPYYGLQIKTARDMQDYWFGEAILVR